MSAGADACRVSQCACRSARAEVVERTSDHERKAFESLERSTPIVIALLTGWFMIWLMNIFHVYMLESIVLSKPFPFN